MRVGNSKACSKTELQLAEYQQAFAYIISGRRADSWSWQSLAESHSLSRNDTVHPVFHTDLPSLLFISLFRITSSLATYGAAATEYS